MKVVHIAAHLGGGAGKAIVGLINSDDTIIILEKPQRTYWFSEAVRKGVSIIIEPDSEEIEKLLKESDITVINWWGHPLMVQFVAKLPETACRLVLYCHVNGCVYPYLPFPFLNVFDAVMFTTPYSYENPLWTSDERKKIKEKSTVVYGMGDFAPESYYPRASYDRKEIFRVGYIGTLNYAKLNPDFVKYCERAADKVKNIRFLLAGDLSENVREDIRRSRISEQFEYAGYVEHTEDFYKQIDVLGYLLNGYNFATTENVLLEAMAYAIPIVVLDQGVERYIIEDGKNGYLVKNSKEYTKRLLQLYESEGKRRELGEIARKSCIEKYANDRNRNAYDQILCKCLSMSKRVHRMNILRGKTPFEWFLMFAQKDAKAFDMDIEDVYVQKSKGSVFQYAEYFHKDVDLRNISERLKKARLNHEFKDRKTLDR